MGDAIDLEDAILVALRRITRAIDTRSRLLFQHYGLTAPQLAALHAIARFQPVTAGGIARAIHLGQPTVTGILDRLDRRGLIARTRDLQDRRSVSVRLTAEGGRVLEHAPSLLQDQFQTRLSQLEPWERTQILATLQRIASMMDDSGMEEPPLFDDVLSRGTDSPLPLSTEAEET